jgi:hypothetical protein
MVDFIYIYNTEIAPYLVIRQNVQTKPDQRRKENRHHCVNFPRQSVFIVVDAQCFNHFGFTLLI